MIRTSPGLETDAGSPRSSAPSIGSLLRDLANESRTLLRQEIDLAKTELIEKARMLGRNVAFLIAGALVLYLGVLALLAAACLGMIALLSQSIDPAMALWLGPLIVGVVVALVGYVLVQKAISAFQVENLTPRQTIDSLRDSKDWLKEQMATSEGRIR